MTQSRVRGRGESTRGWRPGGDRDGRREARIAEERGCRRCLRQWTVAELLGSPVTDGPLIVQSDKTLLLEVDHPTRRRGPRGHRAVRRARALARARPHLPADPARAVERARRRARRRAGRRRAGALLAATPCRTRCWSTSPTRWTATAGCSWSSTRCTGWCLVSLDRAVLEEVLRQKKIAPMLGERVDDDTVLVHPSERGRLKQALLKVGWPAEDLAGYVDGEAHPIALDESDWDAARLPAAGRRHVLGRRLRRGRAALRRRQDARRRGRDGAGARPPR